MNEKIINKKHATYEEEDPRAHIVISLKWRAELYDFV